MSTSLGTTIDRAGLAQFLRSRRDALQPADVGLPAGVRRRTRGLRREELAQLAGMSTDYYSRLEQQRGPHPSAQMIAAIAQALHLRLDERDHLFRLAGLNPPDRVAHDDHVGPGMMRIVDRLADTPAMVVNSAGETLWQNALCVALIGDDSVHSGYRRSVTYRWFTDEATRARFPEADHDHHARAHTARLRTAVTMQGPRSRAARVADELRSQSPQFAELWDEHDVGTRLADDVKRLLHPDLGLIEVNCQTLLDPDRAHALLVYTAIPGSESHEKLSMLSAVMV